MITHGRIASTLRAAAPPAIIVFAATILILFPPTRYNFYPQCPIHQLLHLQCPGCGATRALAALLGGHLVEALRANALITLLLPFAAAYCIVLYRRFLKRKPLRSPQLPPAAIYAAFAAIAIFTVARNLVPLTF
ncbi:MAG: DUF2752 domain-containing protein [Edaphobacter sp.]